MSLRSLFACLLLLFLPGGLLSTNFVDAAALSSTGVTVSLNGVPYFVSPYSSGKVSVDSISVAGSVSVGGLFPITILDKSIMSTDFSLLMANFTARDDVFQAGFIQCTSST